MVVMVSAMVSTVISDMITMVPMISASAASPTSGKNTSGGGEQGDDGY